MSGLKKPFQICLWALSCSFGLMAVMAMVDLEPAHQRVLAERQQRPSTSLQLAENRPRTSPTVPATPPPIVIPAADEALSTPPAAHTRLPQSAPVQLTRRTREPSAPTTPVVLSKTTEQIPTAMAPSPTDDAVPPPIDIPSVEEVPALQPKSATAAIPQPAEVAPPNAEASAASKSVKQEESDSQLHAERLERRLASIQRQMDQLAQADLENRATGLEWLMKAMQQKQQVNRLGDLEKKMNDLETQARSSIEPATQQGTDGQVQAADRPVEKTPTIMKAQPRQDNPERFALQIQDAELTEVLKMLGQLAGLNILTSKGVTGTVTANLNDVNVEQALTAILRSHGYVHQREDGFVFVMTAEEAKQRQLTERKLRTRIYRPNYVSVKELQTLVQPLLSADVGKMAVTTPSEVGIKSEPDKAGGDQLAQQDALLVQDYDDILAQIDQVVVEVDVPPMQVVIEAMILSVKLADSMEFGVNFALLSGSGDDLLISGNGETINGSVGIPDTSPQNIVAPFGQFVADTAGLKYGLIRGNVSAFIEALENISDTDLIAAPQVRVLNKQKAELIIGDRISYKTLAFNGTQTVENVNFLDSGTKLLLRPFISSDGLIRMEVHPERSSAVLDKQTGLPNQATTEVTTNIMVRDGATVVIGGLIEEQISESFDRVPLLGSIPVVGPAFRNKSERSDRTEMIVLITPRIVREPEDEMDGEVVREESLHRQENFKNHLAPINRNNLARMEYEKAQKAFDRGEFRKARRHVDLALRQSKNNVEALQLKDQLDAQPRTLDTSWLESVWPSSAPRVPLLMPAEVSPSKDAVNSISPPPAPAVN